MYSKKTNTDYDIARIRMQLDDLTKIVKEILVHVKMMDEQTKKIRAMPELFFEAMNAALIDRELKVTDTIL